MTFPINSVSVQTTAIRRIGKIAQRMDACHRVAYAAVFDCRRIDGSSEWSQHSWGNAMDLMPKLPQSNDDEDRRIIADAFVYQATHRTRVNRFIKLAISQVIDHDGRRVWEPASGWQPYGGGTGNHVHLSGRPLRTGVPPCA